jgi:hypothetical protein
MLDLYNEFRLLIGALDEQGIEYALCGGMAMAVYDHPRTTIDIDLLILSESLDRVFDIASTLSYSIRGMDMTFASGAIEIRRVSKVHSETGQLLSLDFLLVTPAIRDVWDARVQAEWEGGELSVVSRSGLIELKKLRASAQDQADISALQEDVGDARN